MTIQKYPGPDRESVQLRFSIPDRVEQGVVSVVGSFNDWTPGVHPFALQTDGTRTADVTVPAGADVHFRYLASDGEWFDDPDADKISDHGGVLHLPLSQATAGTTQPAPSPAAGDVTTAAGDVRRHGDAAAEGADDEPPAEPGSDTPREHTQDAAEG